jgi:putative endonuclease
VKDSGHRIELGKRSEDVAVAWLCNKGFVVLERNFRGYRGEVDIVAMRLECVYLIEVRSGRNDPELILRSISRMKINKVVQTGVQYMQETGLTRYDVKVLIIAVTWYNRGRPNITAVPVY